MIHAHKLTDDLCWIAGSPREVESCRASLLRYAEPTLSPAQQAATPSTVESVCQQQWVTEAFDKHGRMVYSIALRVLKDPARAEDVLQDVFLKLVRKPQAFDPDRGSLPCWLATLSRNRAIDMLREQKPTVTTEDVELLCGRWTVSHIEQVTLLNKVRAVMKTMPALQRESLELAYFEGFSHSEVSERTGEPLGTVKTRIRLAVNALRKSLG